MKKKTLKILAFLAAMAMIGGLGYFANALIGNPVSKILAKRMAEKHLEEMYADTDFYIDHISFDFKSVSYLAYIKSESSMDSHFSLYFNMLGKLERDDYENYVLGGWNTYDRMNTTYRELVDTVLENPFFPGDGDIGYGDLEIAGRDLEMGEEMPDYGLKIEELELDQLYDVRELGEKHGNLTIYMEDKEVTVERAAELMLEVKRLMDAGGAPFYAMDFVLQPPKPEGGAQWSEERVEVIKFPSEDIYEEGMRERVKAADEAAERYREQQEKEKY